jgi:hypothetical protein
MAAGAVLQFRRTSLRALPDATPHQWEQAHVLENDERCAHNVCVK